MKRIPLRTSRALFPGSIGLLIAIAGLTLSSDLIRTANAQSSTATISGIVTDEHGAVIDNVNVVILSTERGLKREVSTNGDGYFAISPLPPGRYALTAQHQGFSRVEITDVVLTVSENRSLTIRMKVGPLTESV